MRPTWKFQKKNSGLIQRISNLGMRKARSHTHTHTHTHLLASLALVRLRSPDKLLKNEAVLALLESLAFNAFNVPESG